MKKKIYSSALTALLLSASSIALAGGPEIIPEPDYFSGLYIGGMGGVHHNTFDATSTVDLTQPIALFNIIPLTLLQAGRLNTNNTSGGGFDGYGGVQGGFGKVFNHQFYAGVVGWGEWGSTSETNNQGASVTAQPISVTIGTGGETVIDLVINQNASASTSTTVKVSRDEGVAAKLGWVVAPRSMLYGKIGASWADIKVSNSLNVNSNLAIDGTITPPVGPVVPFNISNSIDLNASSSSSADKIGLVLGAGFEQFLYQDVVSLFVEYTYTNYGHVSTPAANLSGFDTFNSTLIDGGPLVFPVNTNVTTEARVNSVQVSTLMAGLNFYFHGGLLGWL